ncbi:MAG: RNA methyltransferase [Lachnospiraceae bacterium]|nr:RNA methyltransferase [Lachnospiraceae bacterium]
MAQVDVYDCAYNALQNIEWDFVNYSMDTLESIHPYPARFIPEIPKALIKTLGCPPDQKIFDPFCGSGTTLVEAARMGYSSIGVDLNPIACLISRVKLNPLSVDFLSRANEVVEKAKKRYNDDILIPNIPNLDHWFKKDIQKAITAICNEIDSDDSCNDALKMALSSIIVRVSNQESDTRYAAVDNNYVASDVFLSFYNACINISNAKANENFQADTMIIESDILKVRPSQLGNNIGLVITSPPYPNAYEYWLYHKYRMWWLGYDPINVRTNEIGARPHYQKKNGQTELDFQNQMSAVFSLISNCLVQGGHVCFVIGRSIIKRKEINNAALLIDVANNLGFKLVANIKREIASTKKSFNLAYGKIKSENIVIFRKDF